MDLRMGDPSPGSAVSVVIPHFGSAGPTLDVVESLRGQETSGPIQVVVVDDRSPIPFPDVDGVTVVRRDVNGGFGAAVNSGVALAEHSLLLILNSDLEIPPMFVAELLAAAGPWQPAVASPQVVDRGGSPQWVGRHFPAIRHQVVEWLTPLARWRHLPALHEAVGHDTRCKDGVVIPVDWVMGAAMLIPTDAFREVGGFDERFFMNSEEADLQRRLRERGIPSVFVGTVRVTHEGGGSSDSDRRRHWLVDSRMFYAQKWGNVRALRAALRLASVINLAVNVVRQAAGRDLNAMQTFRRELGYLRKES